MKKFRFVSDLAAMTVVVSILVFCSCSKQELNEQVKIIEQDIKINKEMVIDKIISFKEKMAFIKDNPTYKSVEFTTTDSAVWYLDATLNLSHAFISWEILTNFHHDSVVVTIPNTDGNVNYNDLALAYYDLKQKVTNVCITAPGSEKELYIASLTKKEDNGNEITLIAEATIGSRGTPPDNNPFEHGWMYGDLYGNSPDPNPYVGSADACTQLRDKVNEFRYLYVDDEQMVYISEPGEEPYTTFQSQNSIFINEDDPIPGDNYYERLLIYQEEISGYHDLIEEDEMNWYYHKLNYVIYNMAPDNQQEWPNAYGKTFIMVVNEPAPFGTYGTKDWESYIIHHQYKVEYRIGIYVGDKTEPESIVEN